MRFSTISQNYKNKWQYICRYFLENFKYLLLALSFMDFLCYISPRETKDPVGENKKPHHYMTVLKQPVSMRITSIYPAVTWCYRNQSDWPVVSFLCAQHLT